MDILALPRTVSADVLPRGRVLLIRNPIAGNGRGKQLWESVLAQLDRMGCDVTVRETSGCGAAETLASQAARGDFHAAIVAGGDGTINEAVNGLIGSSLPMGIIPLGTANVLAAEIGLPVKAEAIARTILCGRARPAHVGEANGRHFIQMAGVGFDAHVVRNVSTALKRKIGKGAYVFESVRALAAFDFPRYRLTLDGVPCEAASAIVANGHFYGGRFVCAPDASLEDPRFHVCLFERSGAWNAMRYANALLLGRLGKLRDVRIVPATEIVVEGPLGDPVQGDGDIVATLPATIRPAAHAVNLIRPATDHEND